MVIGSSGRKLLLFLMSCLVSVGLMVSLLLMIRLEVFIRWLEWFRLVR